MNKLMNKKPHNSSKSFRFMKGIKPLKRQHWDYRTLEPLRKNCYNPHPDVIDRPEDYLEEYVALNKINVFGTDIPKPVVYFEEGNFPDYVMDEIKRNNFDLPTAIQSQGWPIALSGRDMVGISKSRSGKSLTYILPAIIHILHQPPLNPGDGPLVLILLPSRVNALNVDQMVRNFIKGSNIRSLCVCGGQSKEEQMEIFKEGVEIVIATPGRLSEYLEIEVTNLRRCSYLVLDELTGLLDIERQVRQIIYQARPDRQLLIFTTMFTKDHKDWAQNFLRNYLVVKINTNPYENIKQIVDVCRQSAKNKRLIDIMKKNNDTPGKIIIFCKNKSRINSLINIIYSNCGEINVNVSTLFSSIDPNIRNILEEFRTNKTNVIIVGDEVVKILDPFDLKLLINYDFPNSMEMYKTRLDFLSKLEYSPIVITLLSPMDSERSKAFFDFLTKNNQKINPKHRKMMMRSQKGKRHTNTADDEFYGSDIGSDNDQGFQLKEIKWDDQNLEDNYSPSFKEDFDRSDYNEDKDHHFTANRFGDDYIQRGEDRDNNMRNPHFSRKNSDEFIPLETNNDRYTFSPGPFEKPNSSIKDFERELTPLSKRAKINLNDRDEIEERRGNENRYFDYGNEKYSPTQAFYEDELNDSNIKSEAKSENQYFEPGPSTSRRNSPPPKHFSYNDELEQREKNFQLNVRFQKEGKHFNDDRRYFPNNSFFDRHFQRDSKGKFGNNSNYPPNDYEEELLQRRNGRQIFLENEEKYFSANPRTRDGDFSQSRPHFNQFSSHNEESLPRRNERQGMLDMEESFFLAYQKSRDHDVPPPGSSTPGQYSAHNEETLRGRNDRQVIFEKEERFFSGLRSRDDDFSSIDQYSLENNEKDDPGSSYNNEKDFSFLQYSLQNKKSQLRPDSPYNRRREEDFRRPFERESSYNQSDFMENREREFINRYASKDERRNSERSYGGPSQSEPFNERSRNPEFSKNVYEHETNSSFAQNDLYFNERERSPGFPQNDPHTRERSPFVNKRERSPFFNEHERSSGSYHNEEYIYKRERNTSRRESSSSRSIHREGSYFYNKERINQREFHEKNPFNDRSKNSNFKYLERNESPFNFRNLREDERFDRKNEFQNIQEEKFFEDRGRFDRRENETNFQYNERETLRHSRNLKPGINSREMNYPPIPKKKRNRNKNKKKIFDSHFF